jgi:hypothetical protein
VRHGKARHQTSIDQMELALMDRGEAPTGQRSGEARPTAPEDARSGNDDLSDLMLRVVERSNLARALKRVRPNTGRAGVDGMTVDELVPHLRDHWPAIREQLLTGRYQPSAVRQHAIPKGEGRMRILGIPTGLDRFILHPAGRVTGPATAMRSHLLGVQLWLSAGAWSA